MANMWIQSEVENRTVTLGLSNRNIKTVVDNGKKENESRSRRQPSDFASVYAHHWKTSEMGAKWKMKAEVEDNQMTLEFSNLIIWAWQWQKEKKKKKAEAEDNKVTLALSNQEKTTLDNAKQGNKNRSRKQEVGIWQMEPL